MRAVVIAAHGGVEALEVREVERPRALADRVRVRVRAAGLNRADLLQRRGRYPAPPGAPADIPGLEFAGEVDETGDEVRALRAGQRVFGITAGGAQAEYVVVPENHLAEIPPDLGFEEAAAVPEVFITAHDALFTQARPADGRERARPRRRLGRRHGGGAARARGGRRRRLRHRAHGGEARTRARLRPRRRRRRRGRPARVRRSGARVDEGSGRQRRARSRRRVVPRREPRRARPPRSHDDRRHARRRERRARLPQGHVEAAEGRRHGLARAHGGREGAAVRLFAAEVVPLFARGGCAPSSIPPSPSTTCAPPTRVSNRTRRSGK